MYIHAHQSIPPTITARLIPVYADALEDALARFSLPAALPFRANAQEHTVIYVGEQRTFLLGLGTSHDPRDLFRIFKRWMVHYREYLPKDLAIEGTDEPLLAHAVQGIALGRYHIPRTGHKQTIPEIDLTNLHFTLPDTTALDRVLHISEAQMSAMTLVDTPANLLTPSILVERVQESGRVHGYSVEVWGEQRVLDEGLQALWSVSRGSVHEPYFVRAHYRPEGLPEDALRIALVGKGVTFDTGGISLKVTQSIQYMKTDMGGAAVMIGAMEAAARLGLPVALDMILCICENAIDARSIYPGDVIDSYSGQTIEVLNTDAEGRLILADGLTYAARHLKPDVMIDAATLTGSCVRALGYDIAGIFSKNDALAEAVAASAATTGEAVWRLPLLDWHGKFLQSDVADIRNIANADLAGASLAAKFLEAFTEEHPAWLHMDVAGVVFDSTPFSKEKSATGYGPYLLTHLIEQMIAQPERWKRATP
ncbi:MAG: M17 family metallopeptidase [Bernardetiaceae bacterium]